MIFGKKRREPAAAQTVPSGISCGHPFSLLGRYAPLSRTELRLYETLREAVPIIDAAVCKIVRLVGGFTVQCPNLEIQRQLGLFLTHVPVNACGQGVESFLNGYLEQLLTYGTAVGEMVVNHGTFQALYHAPLEDVQLTAHPSPLEIQVQVRQTDGSYLPAPRPELLLTSTLNPQPGRLYGESILKGLPFVTDILLKIYHSIGLNWERVGNVRFAVTYRPGNDPTDRAYSKERAESIAREWRKAMQGGSGRVSDFISVGDVDIRVIGADNQVLDSEVPVRQLLEQIVAKLSIPPFLLGLSWSSTERMSSQQADILTSELGSYRRLLNPVICKICSLWLRLNGYPLEFEIVWNKINLQDEVELANARLLNARALQLEQQIEATGTPADRA